MKLQGLVLSDTIVKWDKSGDMPAGQARQLTLMDRDDTPLRAPIVVTVDEADPVCPATKGASCEGVVVTVAVYDVRQNPQSKRVQGKGHLVSLDGRLVLQPIDAKKAA